jgi:hypothetical protein
LMTLLLCEVEEEVEEEAVEKEWGVRTERIPEGGTTGAPDEKE